MQPHYIRCDRCIISPVAINTAYVHGVTSVTDRWLHHDSAIPIGCECSYDWRHWVHTTCRQCRSPSVGDLLVCGVDRVKKDDNACLRRRILTGVPILGQCSERRVAWGRTTSRVRQPFLLEGQTGYQEIDSGPHVHYISLPWYYVCWCMPRSVSSRYCAF